MNKLVVLVGILGWSVLLYSGCMASGDDALTKMNSDEREYYDKTVSLLEIGVTYEDVVEKLGEPDRGAGSARPSWKPIADDNLNQIAIYFNNGKVRKIKWMKVGVFMWEKS